MNTELRELLADVVALCDVLALQLDQRLFDHASICEALTDLGVIRERAHRALGRLESDSN